MAGSQANGCLFYWTALLFFGKRPTTYISTCCEADLGESTANDVSTFY
jgi:hypothetical protein